MLSVASAERALVDMPARPGAADSPAAAAVALSVEYRAMR
jgi:hypothetical protein